MEKETLKQQIDEKDRLLKDAYEALEQIEAERQVERSRFEDEIFELKKVISQQNTLGRNDSDHSNADNRGTDSTKTTEQVSENSQKLLFEAFGSVNLGTHQETNGESATVEEQVLEEGQLLDTCLLYTSPSPRDRTRSRMPSSA